MRGSLALRSKFYEKNVFKVENRLPRRYAPRNDELTQARHCERSEAISYLDKLLGSLY